MNKLFSFLLVVSLLLAACSVEKRDIKYGTDVCQFCKMIIVDNQFASEMITVKGKIYVYDSIECLLNARAIVDGKSIALYYVSDFSNPGKLIDATQSFYIQSENIPSPMGENIAAFEKEDSAVNIQSEKGGVIFDWVELKKKYSVED